MNYAENEAVDRDYEVKQARRETRAEIAMKQLAESVSVLQEQVQRMWDRLEPVLGPAHPTAVDGDSDTAVEDRAPLVAQIDNNRRFITQECERLGSLIERLQV